MSTVAESTQFEVQQLQTPALEAISKAEIDKQIATAHAYPRSIEKFKSKCMATLKAYPEIAKECFYILPRAGKQIEGPSVRLAELVALNYQNLRVGSRVTDESREFIMAQGICHDLENNVAVSFEVRRRITDRDGVRYNTDMIGVTGNAAAAIARRNAVFGVIPKMLWNPLYEEARNLARGSAKSRRAEVEAALVGFERLKVKREIVFEYLGVSDADKITGDQLVTLIGIGNAIKNGETSPEEAFGKPEEAHNGPRRKSESAKEGSSKESPKDAPDQSKAQEPDKKLDLTATEEERREFMGKVFSAGIAQVDLKDYLRQKEHVDKIAGFTKAQLDELLPRVLEHFRKK